MAATAFVSRQASSNRSDTLGTRNRGINRWTRVALLVAMVVPLPVHPQSEVTSVLWDAGARDRVVRRMVRGDFAFSSIAAIETPSGPAVLAALGQANNEFRVVRIERHKGNWRIGFDAKLAAETHHFYSHNFFQNVNDWTLIDADGDGHKDALFAGCGRVFCYGTFSLALFGAEEPEGWIIHVTPGARATNIKLTLSSKPPPKQYRGFLRDEILSISPRGIGRSVDHPGRDSIDAWFRKLP